MTLRNVEALKHHNSHRIAQHIPSFFSEITISNHPGPRFPRSFQVQSIKDQPGLACVEAQCACQRRAELLRRRGEGNRAREDFYSSKVIKLLQLHPIPVTIINGIIYHRI